jgi:hypothetical protein
VTQQTEIWWLGLALSLCLGLAGSVCAQPDSTVDAGEVERLVQHLGSQRFTEREAAMRALEALGAPALSALRKAFAGTDLEVRRRAETLLRQIERRLESARLTSGKSVALSFDDMPVHDALDEFNCQTGFSLRIHADDLPKVANRKITLKTGTVTLWKGFDRFCAAAGLVERDLEKGVGLSKYATLHAGTPRSAPTSYAGGLRLKSLSTPIPGWGQTPGVYEVACTLEVAAEPDLLWHGVLDVQICRAVDENGQELRQVVGRGDGHLADMGIDILLRPHDRRLWDTADAVENAQGCQQVAVQLKLADKPSHRIKSVDGILIGQMLTPPENLISISDVLKSAGRTFQGSDGSVLKITDASRDDRGVIKLDIEYRGPPGNELPALILGGKNRRVMNQMLIWQVRAKGRAPAIPKFQLEDSAGRAFDLARYNEWSQVQGLDYSYSASLHFVPPASAGAPARLLLIDRRTAIVEVPFTLRDVPLH